MGLICRSAVMVVLILCLGSLSVAADLEEGFMSYKWGEDISRYQELNKLYTKGDTSYYSNPAESYVVDDISVGEVIYGFFKDQLFAVYINIDNLETYDKINVYMKRKYGLPSTKISTKEYLQTYKWKYKNVTIKLKQDQIDGKMKLALYHRPLSLDLRKEQPDAFSENTFRFFPVDKHKQPEMIPFLEF